MKQLESLFNSPGLYPLRIEFKRQIVHFVCMSRRTYRESVFLDTRTRQAGEGAVEVRLHDLLLVAATMPAATRRIHYILHTTFCCSTLLARYFELIPDCLVLKEPMLLTQLALIPPEMFPEWEETFALCVKLLTRTYAPNETVVIKAHEPVNVLANRLLENDEQATITFLVTPLRQFLLSVLKSDLRRSWVRARVDQMSKISAPPFLAEINALELSDPQAVTYFWLVNRFLCDQLCSGKNRARVIVCNGEHLVEAPGQMVSKITATAGLPLDRSQLEHVLSHPSVKRHSKNPSLDYDSTSRRRELGELEHRLGKEVDQGTRWAADLKVDQSYVKLH